MATARSTVKAQRGKLARFSANRVFIFAKPGRRSMFLPPSSATVSSLPSGATRAGACSVGR
jgi:hypothetical protein